MRVVFADYSFPDAPIALQEAGHTDFEIGTVADGRSAAARVLVPMMSKITGSVMDSIDGLTLIQQWGAGLEGVDVGAATQRGIAVGNVGSTTSGNAESVAEWCIMTALALSRQLGVLEATVRGSTASGYTWGGPKGQAMLGRRALVVGLGGIGTALEARLQAFGMTVASVTRSPGSDNSFGIGELHAQLALSDYVFLCLPLTTQTTHIVDASALAAMRPGAFLINAGRGGLVDEPALTAALTVGSLGGAGLDVFATEPVDPHSPLLQLPNVVATPHIAGVTDYTYRATAARFVELLADLDAGRPLTHAINWNELPGGR